MNQSCPEKNFAIGASPLRRNSTGKAIIALTFDMKDDCTDGELERVFQMTKALGVNRIATSTTFTVAERIAPLMKQFKTEGAFHGHSNAADPNQFAGPDSFRRVLQMSPYAKINSDIGSL